MLALLTIKHDANKTSLSHESSTNTNTETCNTNHNDVFCVPFRQLQRHFVAEAAVGAGDNKRLTGKIRVATLAVRCTCVSVRVCKRARVCVCVCACVYESVSA
jgi:hypothetical protein